MMIHTRKIKQDDIKALHRILLETWYKDKYYENKKLTNAYVQLDLDSCLNDSSFGKVAEINGEVAGVIMGSVKKQPKDLRVFQSSGTKDWLTLLYASEKERSTIIKEIEFNLYASEKLLKENKADNYEGRITLFAVLPEARGFGVGTILFDEIMQHFSNHLIKRYYLFTDSNSNYSYYDRHGLKQVGHIDQDDDFRFYMYEYDFKDG